MARSYKEVSEDREKEQYKSPFANLAGGEQNGPHSGVVQCIGLGCEVEFHSPDKRRFRLCVVHRQRWHQIRGGKTAAKMSGLKCRRERR